MKFQHTLIALLSLLTYANAYDYFTTTLANQTPTCSPVDVQQNVCTEVCGKFIRYVPDATNTNQFTFNEYTTNQCTAQVSPPVTNTFVCADQTQSHALGGDWSGVCKITPDPTTPNPTTPNPTTPNPTTPNPTTPNPTPSQTSTTTGSASTVVASLSLIIFSMILSLC
ncbi:hypothetical protein ACTFIZ_005039 [Dictyostelium cf. discoideum]